MVAPLEMNCVGHDPNLAAEDAPHGVALLELDQLLSTSDVVCICCALTPDTHHLLNATRLGQMKRTAFLVNVSRGPVVDQAALTRALGEQELAGAALDVFEQEPIAADDPLLKLENVILSPHSICWTDELFKGNGYSACQSIVDVANGQLPRDVVVNPDVLDSPTLLAKLNRS